MHKKIELGPDHQLTSDIVSKVAHDHHFHISLSRHAVEQIRKSRQVVERILGDKRIVYGLTTGFGSFKDKFISQEDLTELQNNLIRSHACGVGKPLSSEAVRAAMLVRLNSLAQGYSGVRLELTEFLVELLNKNVIPYVPSQGSVGSSGDLAPLSHMGLLVIEEGDAWYEGELMLGKEALERAGIKAPGFMAKEGLAWNNGTSVLTGIGALALDRAKKLVNNADVACALSLEALMGVSVAYKKEIHELRKHPGQITSASNILDLVEGSRLVDSDPKRVQDAYSLRCAPQVHGAVRDAVEYAEGVITRELNAVTDNPLIFEEPDRAMSGGNFHGEPVAIAMDVLGIALAELANISERRVAKLIDPALNHGLPAYLINSDKGGLHSGFMIPQYVAAALVSENKVLAHPASVDSIPTSAGQEDHVSMGTIASRKAWEIAENTTNVIAIEFMMAAQAIDLRDPDMLAKKTRNIYDIIRKRVEFLANDRVLYTDIKNLKELVSEEDLL